ncbi:hypothetical protein LINPERHAP2_LOCUS29826 [Linum perenne]
MCIPPTHCRWRHEVFHLLVHCSHVSPCSVSSLDGTNESVSSFSDAIRSPFSHPQALSFTEVNVWIHHSQDSHLLLRPISPRTLQKKSQSQSQSSGLVTPILILGLKEWGVKHTAHEAFIVKPLIEELINALETFKHDLPALFVQVENMSLSTLLR